MNESTTEIDDLNFYTLLAVLQSGMWLQADFERFLEPYGLSHSRFSILLWIKHAQEGEPIGHELAHRLGVAKSTISRLVEKLLADDLIRCEQDPDDARKKHYSLTPQASELLTSIIPRYLCRMHDMAKELNEGEKVNLIGLLSKIDFLDSDKRIIRGTVKTIADKAEEIKGLCERGRSRDIDRVLDFLNDKVDIPTTKIVDYYLGTVMNPEGIRQIEHYLFHGKQVQRNYCTLYFSRRNEWEIVNKAFKMGLIDQIQAYSR